MSATRVDYLVVGSGLTGATIARRLAEAGREVVLLERRSHVGGSVHDSLHDSGIRVHTYGPHYFRCSTPRVWDFARRFATFEPYAARLKVLAGGVYEDWPISHRALDGYRDWIPPRLPGQPRNFEEACLAKMPLPVYRKMIEGYTRRQWGREPRQLSAELAERIRINEYGERSLTPHCRHQALPAQGYAAWMEAMIAGIPCRRGVDYLRQRDQFSARKLLVFTGPVDEFFGFDEGRLAYRAQRRQIIHHPDRDLLQPCVQVNHANPGEAGPVRTIEWKHLLPADARQYIAGTVITEEYPYSPEVPDAYEYPFPDSRNRTLSRRYQERAARMEGLLICGRLGEYRYLDMDCAIARALQMADRILRQHKRTRTV